MTTEAPTATTTRELNIPESVLDAAQDKAAKVNRRLARYGLPQYEVTFTPAEPRPVYDDSHCSAVINGVPHYFEQGRMVPCPLICWEARLTVTIAGELPRLADWEPVAVLTRDEDAGVVTRVWPNLTSEPDLTAYRTSDPGCDHCHKARHRKDTYVVRNITTGELRQIGSTCLEAFCGVPLRLPTWVLDDPFGELDDDTRSGGTGDWRADVTDALTLAVVIVAKYGYVSRKAARDSYDVQTATADLVDSALFSAGTAGRDLARWADSHTTPADRDRAATIRAWAVQQGDQADAGEYQRNLAAVTRPDMVGSRNLGYLVSAVAAYARALEQDLITAARAQRDALVSTWQGTLGAKLTATGTVLACVPIEGRYGTTTLIKIMDEQGNRYAWFASGTWTYETGTQLTLAGTVKAHTEYQGRPETQLTRCKVGNVTPATTSAA